MDCGELVILDLRQKEHQTNVISAAVDGEHPVTERPNSSTKTLLSVINSIYGPWVAFSTRSSSVGKPFGRTRR
jgi:hypothetical protein